MNLSQFQAAVATRLGLDNTTTGDQPNITGWINDAVNQVLMDTHTYVASVALSGFDGISGDYTLDPSILEIIEIYPTSQGVSYGMQRVTLTDLLSMRRYAPTAASPTIYYALAGANMLMFFPVPAPTDTFTLYYVPVPTALAASGDDPSQAIFGGIPTAYHKAIEYFAAAEAADANDDQSSQYGQKYLLLYQDQIKRIRREMQRRGGQIAQRAIVGPRGPRGHRRHVSHWNDVY